MESLTASYKRFTEFVGLLTQKEDIPCQHVLEGWIEQFPRAKSGPTLTTCQSLSGLLLICTRKLSRYVLQKAGRFSL